VLALLPLLAGCGTLTYPVNAPLAHADPEQGYRLRNLVRRPGDEELFIVLAFSGGGSRAAALAYGVLEELTRHEIVWRGKRERLLDEVDLVYAVSGGAITAAYFALAGDRIFTEFEPRFLSQDVQGRLVHRILSIANLWRLASPAFGRGELLEEELDRTLFGGATFGDLAARRGPFTVISATDMANGARFDFTQDYFDLLCSDLGAFPIARAVAASSAVPLVFAPVTLWNYAGLCGYVPPPVLAHAKNPAQPAFAPTRIDVLARELASYLDRAQRPYVHLLDGGIADNLAVLSLLGTEALSGGSQQLAAALRLRHVRKAVFIMVDASNDVHHAIDHSPRVPDMLDVVRALSDFSIKRYSRESRRLVQQAFRRWQAEATGGDADTRVELYDVDVALTGVGDPHERESLLALPTTLYLPHNDIRQLREAAGQLLRDAPEFRRLLADIASEPQAGAVPGVGQRDERSSSRPTEKSWTTMH
jgi:NTE family protein